MKQKETTDEVSDLIVQELAVRDGHQLPLWRDSPVVENPDYLSKQLITYIGNKRAFLGQIGAAINKVKLRLKKNKLTFFDAFSGSGVVSRFFKAHASLLISNDLEDYAAITARCYLRNKSTVSFPLLTQLVNDLNARVSADGFAAGFIEELYSPRDEKRITKDDRVFYTKDNARRLDRFRQMIDAAPADMRELLLGPLLSEASIHANTAGVFKGFYKDRTTKVGRFGGSNSDALFRILGKIKLDLPVLSYFECDSEVLQGDAIEAASKLKDIDLAYFDPPYNQHPYGSNYFMLNLLVRYERPTHFSRISGIPEGWHRSDYNIRAKSLPSLRRLLENIDSRFLLVSFNDEGFIPPDEMRATLNGLGLVDVIETKYNAFRGSRNLRGRPIHVTEQLFLIERR